ncbi:hypothetical protein J5U23_00623 [Saccharolobus shibatae B12]|uniref:Uncharacterized protein n=1 Tax=Saccharolobus shibatae (strain ATCC 51178 / DSM 5389 / JCM 8931 / NBRC 15437 / B12) TaxID=523848 RepID=A0A8F5BM02_SACSH|nr:hypothetical protein J5U23_00623 [Saccharolobus shibatae B12]
MKETHGIMIAKNIEEHMVNTYKFSIPPGLLEVKHVVPSYLNIKAFLPFTGSAKFVFRILIFVLMVFYSLYTIFKGLV